MNKHLKRSAAFLIAVILAISLYIPTHATAPLVNEYSRYFIYNRLLPRDNYELADALNHLGLLKGTAKGFELERAPTRIEALITVIRLIGKEDEALNLNLTSSFDDVPDWAQPYAGYAQEHGLIYGVGDNRMGALDAITSPQYAVMMLRVLGYNDITGDFYFENALDFSLETGILDEWGLEFYTSNKEIIRNDMVYFMYQTLASELRGSGYPLIWNLVETGVINADTAYGTMSECGEAEDEIIRALGNGFNDKWVRDLHILIDENANIQSHFKIVFKDCIYNLIKEAGTSRAVDLLKNRVKSLTVSIVQKSSDKLFRNSDEVVAYYQYPNRIVIRDDLDELSTRSTISHEFRHALTSSLEVVPLEEGLTELWNQEVDNGEQGYPYYYVNIAKLITHLTGGKAMNGICLAGSEEELLYVLELNCGTSINKDRFRNNISALSYDDYSSDAHADLNYQFLQLLTAYYNKNFQSILKQNSNPYYYTDTLIALGQMLYYPSAAIADVESDPQDFPPSDFYTAAYLEFVENALTLYSQAASFPIDELRAYFANEKDSRYYIKYLGPDVGNIFEKNASSYTVFYDLERITYYRDFKYFEDAEQFAFIYGSEDISENAFSAFSKKQY